MSGSIFIFLFFIAVAGGGFCLGQEWERMKTQDYEDMRSREPVRYIKFRK